MMEELMREVAEMENRELIRALEHHPLFNSDHEAYAVILEEMEELEAEVKNSRKAMKDMWDYVKEDEPGIVNLKSATVEACFLRAAGEAIQAAAMCSKLRKSQDAIHVEEEE